MNKYKWLAALTLVAGSLFGDCGGKCCEPCGMACGCDCCSDCDPCNDCCCTPCSCEPCDFCPPMPPETCAYNAPKFYDLKCSWDMFITGTFVYMQAKEENLEYLETKEDIRTGTVSASISTINRRIAGLTFDYKPALKFGLGIDFGCDNWNFYAEYFRYYGDIGNGSFSQTAPTGTEDLLSICPFLNGNFSSEEQCTSIEANTEWRLEMDMVDLNLRRKYFVGKCLVFQPSVGIKFGWIDQKQTTNYICAQDGGTNTINVENSSDSWAVGAKTGLDTEWNFCGCFRFFGNTSLAILYTDYNKIRSNTTSVGDFPSSNPTVNTNLSTSLCFLRPDAGITLGLGWGDYWCCNDWYFDVSAGYEFHTYWNQNVLPQMNDCSQNPSALFGDLFMHGLVLTARLDF